MNTVDRFCSPTTIGRMSPRACPKRYVRPASPGSSARSAATAESDSAIRASTFSLSPMARPIRRASSCIDEPYSECS
jgi:hypothetical protein